MDKPLIIILIEKGVKDKDIAAALVRAYNNVVAQLTGVMVVLVPIVLYGVYEVFINARSLSDFMSVESWKLVLLFVIQQLIALIRASADKLKRDTVRSTIAFADSEGV